jgi:hypothetical protein
MKKGCFFLLMFALAHTGFAQYSLTFCKEVTTEGKADKPANSFPLDQTGNALKLLVKSDDKFDTHQVEYRIFYVDAAGKEAEVSKLPQSVEPTWDFAWKEVVFYDPGTYRIKVYDDKGIYLTSANVNIKNQ